MTFAIAALAAFLSITVIVILVILVAAIHRDDRAKNLISAPRTRTEHLTRQLLGVGVRTPGPDHATSTPPSCVPTESDLP